MLRSAVERQFEIVGAAPARALRLEPGLEERLPASRSAVDVRNVIAHENDAWSPTTVWDIASHELPALAREVEAELRRLDELTR